MKGASTSGLNPGAGVKARRAPTSLHASETALPYVLLRDQSIAAASEARHRVACAYPGQPSPESRPWPEIHVQHLLHRVASNESDANRQAAMHTEIPQTSSAQPVRTNMLAANRG